MSKIHHLSELAEMVGSDTTSEQAAAARDALIEAGHLEWTSDQSGGELAEIGDDAFYAITTNAIEGGA